MKPWDKTIKEIERLLDFVSECKSNEKRCAACGRAQVMIQRLELEIGTVHPSHRAKSSGALAR